MRILPRWQPPAGGARPGWMLEARLTGGSFCSPARRFQVLHLRHLFVRGEGYPVPGTDE